MQVAANTMQVSHGWWEPGDIPPQISPDAIREAVLNVRKPLVLVSVDGQAAIASGGKVTLSADSAPPAGCYPLCAYVPSLLPQNLGDANFKADHNLKYAYVAGAMANGITSVDMVAAAGKAGMLGFFGAAGLTYAQVQAAIDQCEQRLEGRPFGFNLIHSPHDPALELALAKLYHERNVRRISASAYLDLTLPLVYYRVKGIRRNSDGVIECPNKVIAKVSRVEVARRFLSPPPEKWLRALVEQNLLEADEAELAAHIAMADDISAEADSGGHTDNRPALALLPTMIALRDKIASRHPRAKPVRVGLGGGIATPDSAAAAFAMGAAYILTGTVNQACVEAGTSETVRKMLVEAGQADVTMAPAADMFEMGVKVQVLKRGTMFAQRAAKLYELYRRHDRYDTIPAKERAHLEKDFFRRTFEEQWQSTRTFFEERDPRQIERAEKDPHHKMALVFRAYLGLSSNWANAGEPTRRIDYQIWCGPAIGAFNEWVKGSFLEKLENRHTVTVAMNLLYGAAVMTRIAGLRNQGVVLPAGIRPCTLDEIDALT